MVGVELEQNLEMTREHVCMLLLGLVLASSISYQIDKKAKDKIFQLLKQERDINNMNQSSNR